MKVICISDEWDVPARSDRPRPAFANPYTVVHSEIDTDDGMLMYELAEFPPANGQYFTFDANAFAPLNGPDERDRLEEWQASRLTEVDRLLQACADMMPEVQMEPGAFERVWNNVTATF